MAAKLYVENLPYSTTDSDHREIFDGYGTVKSVQAIKDWDIGRFKGFGFVKMGNGSEAMAAINSLSEIDFEGRFLTVKETKPPEERGGSGGYSEGRGG